MCGSRTLTNRFAIHAMLQAIVPDPMVSADIPTIIEGGAKGADLIAKQWVCGDDKDHDDTPCPVMPHRGRKLPYIIHEQYPADWEKYGRAAGPRRNADMLRRGEPDLVLAFLDKNRIASRGTNDMITKCEVAGVPVYMVQYIHGERPSF